MRTCAGAALLAIAALLLAWGCGDGRDADGTPAPQDSIPIYGFTIVASYPHDRDAYTQGLAFDGGVLYEGTGRYGRSALKKVALESGETLIARPLEARHFGEGVTILGDRCVQITWQSRAGFLFDKATLEPAGSFTYATEGWGIAYDPASARLVMSDGTSTIRFLDPSTFAVVRELDVRAGANLVAGLNELEFVEGAIYANVWLTDRIAIISPETGRVTAWLNLEGLLAPEERDGSEDVLNGIAYDAPGERLFVTGKLWPRLFEIEVVAAR